MNHQVISANRLGDGLVVYLTRDGEWSEAIADAHIADDAAAADLALAVAGAAVARQAVVDPYLVDVDIGGPAPRPTRYREFIRAQGPSVRRDLGKQADHRRLGG